MLKPRRPEIVTLAVALFVALVLNAPFWRAFHGVVQPETLRGWAFLAGTGIALVALCNALLLLFAVRPIFRLVLALLLPATAAAAYFMYEYGVVIDVNMIQNVFETDTREAGDLITFKFVAAVALLGCLPALVIWQIPWAEVPGTIVSRSKATATIASLVVAAGAVFPFWGDFLSTFREHRELRLTLTPSNYLGALSKYLQTKVSTGPVLVRPYGEDAARGPAGSGIKKRLLVIAVGETARADHFGLNGYDRQTTPELAKVEGLINYPAASSCGTDTAQSVPCMFSGLGRENFSNAAAAGQENLLDILKRSGVDVIWRDNQAGCKGVCARVALETLTGTRHEAFHQHDENVDEILLDGLDERIAKLERDTVIILHMMGSHGPAYWKRVPERIEVFKPICRESQFSRCSNEDIINAYDNTILYTDFVLARLIGLLGGAQNRGIDAGMIYMSDHGESLGENNLYLHGMPYAIAPRAQTHIPAVVWLSPGLRETTAINVSCLADRAKSAISHDVLFHSVLSVMDISTKVYEPKLDLFAPCRAKSAS